MKKRGKGIKGIGLITSDYGVYSSDEGKGVKKAQRGIGGIGAGFSVVKSVGNNWASPMGGFLQSGIKLEGQDGTIQANPYVTTVQIGKVDWGEEEADLKNAFKALGQLKQPLAKLFDIEGLDMKELLPIDQSNFNTVKTELMSKYLGEIEKVSPNMTYEDLLKPDVKMAVERATQGYKNAVTNIYNQMKANKNMYEKQEGSRKSLEEKMGGTSNAMLEGTYKEHVDYVSKGGFFGDYYNGKGELDMGRIAGDIERKGTIERGRLLTDVHGYHELKLFSNIENYVTKNITADKIANIQALNSAVYAKDKVGEINIGKVSEISQSALQSVMENQTNNTDFIIKGVRQMEKLFPSHMTSDGQMVRGVETVQDAYSIIEKYGDLRDSGKFSKIIENVEQKQKEYQSLSGKGNNLTEEEKKRKEELKVELINHQAQIANYMRVMGKKDVRKLSYSTYIENSEENKNKIKELTDNKVIDKHSPNVVKIGDKQYYVINNDYYSEGYVGNKTNGDILKKEVLIYKEGDKKKQKAFANKAELDKFINENKDKISIEGIRAMPLDLNEIDTDELQYHDSGTSPDDIMKNLIKGEIYGDIVSAVSTRLHVDIDKDLLFKPASTNVSVSNVMGGGDIKKDDKLASWALMRANAFGLKFNAVEWRDFTSKFIGSNHQDGYVTRDEVEGGSLYLTNAQEALRGSSGIENIKENVKNGLVPYAVYDKNGQPVKDIKKDYLKDIAQMEMDIGYKINNKYVLAGKLGDDYVNQIAEASNSTNFSQTSYNVYKLALQFKHKETASMGKDELKKFIRNVTKDQIEDMVAEYLHKEAEPYYLGKVIYDNKPYFIEVDGGTAYSATNVVKDGNADSNYKQRFTQLNNLFVKYNKAKQKTTKEDRDKEMEEIKKEIELYLQKKPMEE